MMEIPVLGHLTPVREERASEERVEFRDGVIVISRNDTPPSVLLKDFLADILYSALWEVLSEIKREGKVDILGDLDFEIVEKIDDKRHRVAKLKGNRIWVKLSAVALPKGVLKYILAHEISHLITKRHDEKFKKILGTILPEYEEAERLLREFEEVIIG